MRLYCLPYSGASAMVYLRWRRMLPAWIAVRPLELPGRGARHGEPFATDIVTLAQALADEVMADRTDHGEPYAIFGHSMGALLAYEMAHQLVARNAPAAVLMVSGTDAPSCRDEAHFAQHATPRSDDALREMMRKLGGTTEVALESEELMAMVLPVMRADLLLCGRYRPAPRAPLPCRVQVFGGTRDAPAPASLRAWRAETSADFGIEMFDGHHFFIHQQEARLLQCIEASLRLDPQPL